MPKHRALGEIGPEATMQSNLKLPRPLWLKLKILALRRNVPLTEVVTTALEEFVQRERP
jgi:hypothetical protein